MDKFWQTVSISVLPAWVALLAYALYVRSKRIMVLCFIGLCIDVATQIFKTIIGKHISNHQAFHRPDPHAKCGVFNRDSNKVFGTFSMPSGHMASTTFLLVCVMWLWPGVLGYITAFVYILLMALARYYTGCHTRLQVVVGLLYGLFVGLFANIKTRYR